MTDQDNILATSSTGLRHVDPDGDLVLVIGPEKTEYLVCSRTICRASKVFKAMLRGGFLEAQKPSNGSQWKVELPEDDATAAEMFFKIVHARFEAIPWMMTIIHLHDIFVFTNKYDVTNCLRPWLLDWIKCPDFSPYTSMPDMRAIGIARELGASYTYEKLTRTLIMDLRMDEEGRLLSSEDEFLEDMFSPLVSSQLIDHITEARLIALDKLFQVLRDYVSDCRAAIRLSECADGHDKVNFHCTAHWPKTHPGDDLTKAIACATISLGTIMNGLGPLELSELLADKREPYSYPHSPNDLAAKISRMAYITGVYKPSTNHEHCHPRLVLAIPVHNIVTYGCEGLQRPEDEIYMEAQRKRLGFNDYPDRDWRPVECWNDISIEQDG